jgi:hypothetical protein
MTQPLLDGQPVDPSVIDPAKHRYVGMWRPAESNLSCGTVCPGCQQIVLSAHSRAIHWRNGCFDVPQYVSIAAARFPFPEAKQVWDDVVRRYYAGEFDEKKPIRLRIPAREVKKGDVVWRNYPQEGWQVMGVAAEYAKVITAKAEFEYRNSDSVPGLITCRADELVEVERTNG